MFPENSWKSVISSTSDDLIYVLQGNKASKGKLYWIYFNYNGIINMI